MIIAGGVYQESVRSTRHREQLGGSALRAAVALSAASLVTASEPLLAPLVAGLGRTFGFEVHDSVRDKPVGFNYFADFVEPRVFGRDAVVEDALIVRGDAALVFGMVEHATFDIDVATLVCDPQSVDDSVGETLKGARFERSALCLNALEVRALSGEDELTVAARSALVAMGVDVVVVKSGAIGSLVVTREHEEWVGAVPTKSVRKLGTGDIFSAVFAHAWAGGADPVVAARVASFATAWWTAGIASQIPAEILDPEFSRSHSAFQLGNEGRQPLIYLAAPFFTPAELWLVQMCRVFLEQAGAQVFSPIDELGLGGPEVAEQDLVGLDRADGVFAIVDGWDPGTVFEIGWATRARLPVVGVLTTPDSMKSTMLVGTGTELHEDVTTALYRSIWRALGHSDSGFKIE